MQGYCIETSSDICFGYLLNRLNEAILTNFQNIWSMNIRAAMRGNVPSDVSQTKTQISLQCKCAYITHRCPNEEILQPWLSRMRPVNVRTRLLEFLTLKLLSKVVTDDILFPINFQGK